MGDGNSSKGMSAELAKLDAGAALFESQKRLNALASAKIEAKRADGSYLTVEQRTANYAESQAEVAFKSHRVMPLGWVSPIPAKEKTPVIPADFKIRKLDEPSEAPIAHRPAKVNGPKGNNAPKSEGAKSVKATEAQLERQATALLSGTANGPKTEPKANEPKASNAKQSKPAPTSWANLRNAIRTAEKATDMLRAESKRFSMASPKYAAKVQELTQAVNMIAGIKRQLDELGPEPKKTDAESAEPVKVTLSYLSGERLTIALDGTIGLMPQVKAVLLEGAHPVFGPVVTAQWVAKDKDEVRSMTRAEVLENMRAPSMDPVVPSRKSGAICRPTRG